MYTIQNYENSSKNAETYFNENNVQSIDPMMFQQIEAMIQNQYQIIVPALVIEYKMMDDCSKDFTGWDKEDLQEFFSHFGAIDALEVYGKLSVILFKTFIDAFTCQEFLQNSSNFKESEKNKFNARWYCQEDEMNISENLKNKLRIYNSNLNINNSFYNYPRQQNYASNKFNDISANKYNNINTINMNNSNTYNGQNNNSYFQSNLMEYNDENQNYMNENYLQNGKFTCKFEITIDNDNDFQVARRVIGSKVNFNINI